MPFMSWWKEAVILSNCGGQPIFFSNWNSPVLLTRSNAFVKSMKVMYSGICCSRNRENHVYRRSFRSKAALGLGVDAFCKNLESHQNHTGKDLSDDAQEGDTPVVVTIAPIAFVFVQGDDLGITHVLGYLTLPPTETEEFVQWLNQCWLPGFDDFRWNAVFTWGFTTRQGIDSLVEFNQCGLGVKLFEHG